jgi:hypothetical protein
MVEGALRRGARCPGAARFRARLRLAGDFSGIVLLSDRTAKRGRLGRHRFERRWQYCLVQGLVWNRC